MKKLGFTLAEVLITLVIIGVIAAMTVPTLMQNTNAEEFRSGLKKAISGLNQALTLNYALEGLSAQDYTSATELIEDVFEKRMNVIDGATSFTVSECSGSDVFTTADGMMFCISGFTSANSDVQGSICDSYNTTGCHSSATEGEAGGPNIWIDVNGVKKPNRMTVSAKRPKDVYSATIYSQKVVPYGDATQGVMYNLGVGDQTTTSSASAGANIKII